VGVGSVPANTQSRSGWLGPLGFPRRWSRQWLAGFRALADWLDRGSWWLLVGLALGVGPVFIDWLTGLSISRPLTASLGMLLLLAAASRDRMHPALTCLGLAVISHSAAFISLAACDPSGIACMFPPGLEYWEETRYWIETGKSKVYDVGAWGPFHLQLAVVMALWCYLSLGLVPLLHGLHELDLMNVYVGRLIASSEPSIDLIFAWHPWSLCRGVGFLFLTYEITSLSLARLTGEQLSTPARRLRRWMLAVGFLLLDVVIKYFCLESVRRVLSLHLSV
jgi:hypothetical protein